METGPSLLSPEDFPEPEFLADLTNHLFLNTFLQGHFLTYKGVMAW